MDSLTAVALSGGVDSSVAAVLLREKTKHLVGATHFIWPDSRCCSLDVFKRAKYLAEQLAVPYYIIDVQNQFREKIVDNFIQTYVNGKTPNPCVLCNERIRFSLFYDELKKKLTDDGILKKGQPFYFATGHYAQIEKTGEGLFLKKARDRLKDQTYMLYRLPRTMLEVLVFPLGQLLKKEVYHVARERGFSITEEQESQDACFVEDDYVDFIIDYAGRNDLKKPGKIVDTEGTVQGRHNGYIRYTVGQRRGLGLGNGPWYVVRIIPEENLVVVGKKDRALTSLFRVEQLNWFQDMPEKPFQCAVKTRYRARDIPCTVTFVHNTKIEVKLAQSELVTPGQSAVFYKGDLVLGGGIIV